jgi:hypothetical protein
VPVGASQKASFRADGHGLRRRRREGGRDRRLTVGGRARALSPPSDTEPAAPTGTAALSPPVMLRADVRARRALPMKRACRCGARPVRGPRVPTKVQGLVY